MKIHSSPHPVYSHKRFHVKQLLGKLTLGLGLMGIISTSHAAGYFINNLANSGCSDAAPDAGSESKPWCSFAPIANISIQGGDTIHLAQGATWVNQTLRFNSVGATSATSPITIKAYGGGLKRPHITTDLGAAQGNPQAQKGYRGIVLNNASHWLIKDLEISYMGAGILLHYTEKNKENIRFSNLYLHHNYGYERVEEDDRVDDIEFSAGIVITGNGLELEPSEVVVRGIVMEDIIATKNQDAVSISFPSSVTAKTGALKTMGAKNVLFNRVRFFDNDGGGQGVGTGCSDTVRLVKVYDFTMMNSLIEKAGGCSTNKGTAAMFLGYTDGATLINNIIRDTLVMPVTPDQSGIDLEVDNSKVKILGNLFSGNLHAIECMMFHNINFHCDPTIVNNAFINNRRSAMFINGTLKKPEGELKHNLYYTVSGSYLKWNDSDNCLKKETYDPYNLVFELMATTENNLDTNIALPNPENFYSAAADFNFSQLGRWGYQFYNSANAWQNLELNEYQTTRPMWHNANRTLFITPFEMKPAPHAGVTKSGGVARIWKAPKDGVVVIRGQLAKSELDPNGNGILAHIEKQDGQTSAITKLWPPVNDRYNLLQEDMLGVKTQVDSVVVKAGDIVRFAVSSNGDSAIKDTVTWSPMIAYVKDAQGNPGPKSMAWGFNTPNWLEYWGSSYANIAAPAVANGSLNLEVVQNDPYILSRNFKNGLNDLGLLGKDAKFFKMRIKHNLSDAVQPQAVLRWTREGTDADGDFFGDNDAKKIVINLSGTNEYQEIGPLNLQELNALWGEESIITQLRLDPIDGTGHEEQRPTINIDYIRLDSSESNAY